MREFYLQNEFDEQFSLKTNSLHPLVNVSNLGIQYKFEYIDLGNEFLKTKKTNSMTKPQGTIIFYDGYSGYDDFCEFLNTSEKLYLYYSTTQSNYLYCEVEVESLQKSELQKNVLQCKITFNRLTPFKKKRSLETSSKVSVPNIDGLEQIEGVNECYFLEIESDTMQSSPAIITCGVSTNGGNNIIKLAYKNDKVGEAVNYKTNSSIGKFEVDSTKAKRTINGNSAGTILNMFNIQDFSKDIEVLFPRIEKGKNYIYVGSGDSNITITSLKVEFEEVYY